MSTKAFDWNDVVSTLQPRPVLRVLVAYQDAEIGRRARGTLDWMMRRYAEDCEFQVSYLDLDTVAVPSLRETAAEQAAEADLILFAGHDQRGMNREVKCWCDQWLALAEPHDAALVALMESEPGPDGGNDGSSTRIFLEQVARRGGMAFIPHTLPPRPSDQPIRAPNTPRSSCRPAMENWPGWGINE
jgi:hypothetical protein